MMISEDRIRERAHAIWEREGRPEGMEAEHWARARQECAAEALRERAHAAGDATAPPSAQTAPGQLFQEPDPAAVGQIGTGPRSLEQHKTELMSTETQGLPPDER